MYAYTSTFPIRPVAWPVFPTDRPGYQHLLRFIEDSAAMQTTRQSPPPQVHTGRAPKTAVAGVPSETSHARRG